MRASDILDIRIIKELQSPASFRWNARESFASMARSLGVDEETVRKRLADMRQAKVLLGWRLLPNPRLIGQEAVRIDLDVVDVGEKAGVISQLRLLDGVIMIFDYLGTGLEFMMKVNAFFLLPVVDLGKIMFLACSFRVFCPDGRKKHTADDLILSEMGRRVAFAQTSSAEYSTFGLVCANLAEAEEIHDRMRALDGVKEVRMQIEKEIILVHEWVDEQIERQLRETV